MTKPLFQDPDSVQQSARDQFVKVVVHKENEVLLQLKKAYKAYRAGQYPAPFLP
jgi:hypothetical protein